jgi:bifunctional non-homologous end joining protein LigD
MKENTITLYYKEGSSDKVYTVAVEPKGNLWVVNFAYGRRGAAMTTGSKTQEPVELQEAIKIMSKTVVEKQSKGYTVDTTGKAFMHVDKTSTGIYPQLLSAVTEEQVEALLADDDYIMQEKFDGQRRILQKQHKTITGINRKGLAVGLPLEVHQDLAVRTEFINLLLDGEQIDDTVYVFDIIEPNKGFKQRYDILKNMIDSSKFKQIKLVKAVSGYVPKSKLYKELLKAGREGVVFKHKNSIYTPGKPKSEHAQFKYKFYETASFIVNKVNTQRSVELKLYTDNTMQQYVLVGNVTIPVNAKIPSVGAVIEVRYLYAYIGGSVYQPVYLGERGDIDFEECLISQLKYKPA